MAVIDGEQVSPAKRDWNEDLDPLLSGCRTARPGRQGNGYEE
jgi:hypothetical protein